MIIRSILFEIFIALWGMLIPVIYFDVLIFGVLIALYDRSLAKKDKLINLQKEIDKFNFDPEFDVHQNIKYSGESS